MRNMSFALTTRQFRARTKRRTRRLGWRFAKGGDHVRGVVKSQGLKKGERVEPLGVIEVERAWREPLDAITPDEVVLEGFPEMTPAQFVAMFCAHNGCTPGTEITVIAFDYVEEA